MSTKKGIWDLQDIRDKQLQGLWGKQAGKLFSFGRNNDGDLGQNTASPASSSSPIQVGSDTDWNTTVRGHAANSLQFYNFKS